MVGKRVKYIEEFRAYTKVCTKLGHSVMLIFTKMGEVYGSDKVSYEIVRRWRKKFLTESCSFQKSHNHKEGSFLHISFIALCHFKFTCS